MKSTVASALLALALVLGGCASLPSPEAMRAQTAGFQLPVQPAPGRALVYVVRPSHLGTLVRFNVFLGDQADSSELGFTRGGEYLHFELPAGEHKLWSKAENWAELVLQARAGEVLFVEQEASMGFLMARNTLKPLDDVAGRFHVKQLKPGTTIKLPATAAAR